MSAARSVTSSWIGSRASPKVSARSLRVATSRAVAATLSPRSRAALVQLRPKPREAPVMNQVLLMGTRPSRAATRAAPAVQGCLLVVESVAGPGEAGAGDRQQAVEAVVGRPHRVGRAHHGLHGVQHQGVVELVAGA